MSRLYHESMPLAGRAILPDMRGKLAMAMLVLAAGLPAAHAGQDTIAPLAIGERIMVKGKLSDADWDPHKGEYYQRFLLAAEPGSHLVVELHTCAPYPELEIEADDGTTVHMTGAADRLNLAGCSSCGKRATWRISSPETHVLWVRSATRGGFSLQIARVVPDDPDAAPITRANPPPPKPWRDVVVTPRKPLWPARVAPAGTIRLLKIGQKKLIKGKLEVADWNPKHKRYQREIQIEGGGKTYYILRARSATMKPLDFSFTEGNPITTDQWKRVTDDGKHAHPEQDTPGWDVTERVILADKGYGLVFSMPVHPWNETVPPGDFEIEIERVAPVPPPRGH
jgi:hypothetical protein